MKHMETKRNVLRIEYLLMLITTLFWALGHPLGRIILARVHPFQLGAVNLVTGWLCLAVYLLVSRKAGGIARMKAGDLAGSLLLGVLGFFVYQICTFSALARIPASINAVLVATNVVFIALLSVLVYKERVSTGRALGIGMALGGVVLVTLGGGLLVQGQLSLGGCGFSIAAAVSFALYTVLGKRILSRNDPLLVAALAMLSGAALLTALSAATVGFQALIAAPPGIWALMVLLGVTMIGVAYPLWFFCLKRLPATHASVFIYLTPVFAVVLSMAILRERFIWTFWLGAALVLAGIIAANWERRTARGKA
jgi:drug/metabolite transporter (DMT)-like permease